MSSLKARIKISNYCENDCWYCCSPDKNSDEMSEKMMNDIVDKLVEIYEKYNFKRIKISITGGDPFSSRNVLTFMDVINDKIRNNGIFAPVVCDVCKTSDDKIISEFIEKGGKCLVSLNEDPIQKMTSKTLKIGLDKVSLFNVILTEYNINRIDDIIKHVIDFKLPIRLNTLHDPYDQNNLRDNISYCIDKTFHKILKKNERTPYNKRLSDSMIFSCITPYKYKTDSFCGYGKDYLAIDLYGNVSRCHVESPITTIYDKNLMFTIKTEIPHIDEECKKCGAFRFCKGGCVYNNKFKTYCKQFYKASKYAKEMKEK
ncbi:MAG: SPASM domain-containing protein [bacterium]